MLTPALPSASRFPKGVAPTSSAPPGRVSNLVITDKKLMNTKILPAIAGLKRFLPVPPKSILVTAIAENGSENGYVPSHLHAQIESDKQSRDDARKIYFDCFLKGFSVENHAVQHFRQHGRQHRYRNDEKRFPAEIDAADNRRRQKRYDDVQHYSLCRPAPP